MAIEKNIVIGADLSGLEAKLSELIDALKDSQKQADKTSDSINDIADTTKDIGKSAKASKKGVETLSTGFKGLGVAIKAAGIGLLLSAMGILKDLFDNNQKVVDVFNTAFNTLQIAFSDFSKWIESNIGGITGFFKDIFENPLENIQALGDAITENIVERFQSMLEVLGFVGEAMSKFFTGDFKGALDSVKAAGTEMVDVLTGVDDSANKIAEGTANAAKAISGYVTETVKQGLLNR
jgi:methyl-accepting chemotaxis protein